MRIDVKKYDENCYYTHVGIPTTKQEHKFLKELKYELGTMSTNAGVSGLCYASIC